MVKRTSIFGWNLSFVFRHKYEKDLDLLDKMRWNEYKLGVWFKKYKSVGKPIKGPAVIGKDGTLTNSYMIGIHLLVCKFWINISYRPLILNLD